MVGVGRFVNPMMGFGSSGRLSVTFTHSKLTQLTLLAWVPAGRGVAPGSRSGSSSFPASQQTIN